MLTCPVCHGTGKGGVVMPTCRMCYCMAEPHGVKICVRCQLCERCHCGTLVPDLQGVG